MFLGTSKWQHWRVWVRVSWIDGHTVEPILPKFCMGSSFSSQGRVKNFIGVPKRGAHFTRLFFSFVQNGKNNGRFG